MRSFWGLNCLLVALILALVEPAVSHPIRASKWIKKSEFQDFEHRGVWKIIEKKETFYVPDVPQHASNELESQRENTQSERNSEMGLSDRHYKRDASSDESTDSVFVSSSDPRHGRWRHHHEHTASSWTAAHKTEPYGQVLGRPGVGASGAYRSENESSTSSSPLRLAPGHYISFFSYRISFPFLKFAPMSFPQFPLPSIFTTVMVVLALVWIAILTIGLVEVGNYLWRRRYTARLAAESERLVNEESSSSNECLKEPFQVLVVPRAPWRAESHRNEESGLLSNTLEDEFDIEMDDYRMPLP